MDEKKNGIPGGRSFEDPDPGSGGGTSKGGGFAAPETAFEDPDTGSGGGTSKGGGFGVGEA